jgi:hypothetical protein
MEFSERSETEISTQEGDMSKTNAFVIALALGGCFGCVGMANAGPDTMSKWITLSGRGVILAGQQQTEIRMPVPTCASGKEFLVTGVQAAPEVAIGATSTEVTNLKLWAVSVPAYQRFSKGAQLVPLTLIGQGPEHLSATLAAGQSLYSVYDGGPPIIVTVSILGSSSATHRFEFNVHVTGSCGTASSMRG